MSLMEQVLINLITNALKFTRLEATRRIKIVLAASEHQPSSTHDGIQFETKLVPDDTRLIDDWKLGSTVYLQFLVTDTGCGLSHEERSTLFARFSQASPRTHIHYGGSGLGLFISRRLTEMQGGAIGLFSEPGHGSTFSFYIKARRTALRNVRRTSFHDIYPEDVRHRATTRREIDQMQKHPSPSTTNHERIPRQQRPLLSKQSSVVTPKSSQSLAVMRHQSDMYSNVSPVTIGLPTNPNLANLERTESNSRTLHVLVVEDNLVNQKVLAKQLRNQGCNVNVANHGAEALDYLKKTHHWKLNEIQSPPAHSGTASVANPFNDLPVELSLILMDWEMPVMNGLTAVARIRDLECQGTLGGHIPVIGITANVRQQQIETALAAGMDDVVSKPFRVAELMERVWRVVGGVG
jgi:CheY-like chemotaxis protein